MVARFFIFLLLLSPAWALDFGGGFALKAAHARPTLIADSATIAAGDSFTLGVSFEIDDGWHLYWRNYGDIGDVPRFDVTLPEGFTAGGVRWPIPSRFESRSFVNFGYEKSVVYLIPVTAPEVLPEGEINISVNANWLVCDEGECVSDEKVLGLTLQGGPERVADSAGSAAIEASEARLPKPLADSGLTLSAEQSPTHITVTLRGPSLPAAVTFYPYVRGLIDYQQAPVITTADDSLTLRFARPETPPAEEPAEFSGVLVLADGAGYGFDAVWGGKIAESAAPAVAAKPMPAGELLATLLAAFLGGLILNLMPCVLPVVSIKVLSFVKAAGESRRAALTQGLTFAAGVLVSFWVVAGILLALRGLGASLGWGFQLQSPIFVLCLVMLLFLMALNMFGVFEIGTSLVGVGAGTSKKGLTGAFFSGVLATVVATPCTAPFMGAALGAALASSALISFTIFTALALGMASPYVVLCAFPPLLRMVPKPGEWMIGFKQFLGFLLAATVVWLVGVFGSLEAASGDRLGVHGVVILLAGLVLISIAGWVYGRAQNPMLAPKRMMIGRVIAILALIAGIAWPWRLASAPPSTVTWQAWSPQLIQELESAGTPYFIDFTAEWCLSCQANKGLALNKKDVAAEFAAREIVAVRADWTNKDAEIAGALESYGRAGVPLYVLSPGAGEPVILPNILTKGIVLKAVKTAFDSQ